LIKERLKEILLESIQ